MKQPRHIFWVSIISLLLYSSSSFSGKLHEAARKGNIKLVKLLLKAKFNVDAIATTKQCTNKNSKASPLHWASSHPEIAKLLIDAGANVDIKNSSGWAPLHSCIYSGNTETVKLLIEAGANIEVKTSYEYSGWHKNATPLHCAAGYNNIIAVKSLIDAGADIGAQTERLATPLHFASDDYGENKATIIKLLLKAGANKHARQHYRQSRPLEYAIYRGEYSGNLEKVFRLLFDPLSQKDQQFALHCAAQYGTLKIVKLLFSLKARINEKNENGLTPLHVARNREIADYLITKSANLNTLGENNLTPLHTAAQSGNLEVVRFLLLKGANSEAQTTTYETALDLTNIALSNASEETKKNLEQVVITLKASQKATQTSYLAPNTAPQRSTKFSSTVSDFILDYSTIKLGEKLGEGGFGSVYKARWQHQDVAVKQLHMERLSKDGQKEFEQETRIWSKLRHPNIIPLLGICIPPAPYSMIMPYKPKGSLYDLLKSKQRLTWTNRKQLALDIGSALEYLHSKKMLHRDLKSLNILVAKQEGNYRGSLTDFGLSIVKNETITSSTKATQSSGTLLWMAPELLRGKPCTKKSDIYAYGMILWELASRKLPFKDAHPSVISTLIKDGDTPDIPKKIPTIFTALITQCWSMDTKKRPSLNEILNKLGKLKTKSSSAVKGNAAHSRRFGNSPRLTRSAPRTRSTIKHHNRPLVSSTSKTSVLSTKKTSTRPPRRTTRIKTSTRRKTRRPRTRRSVRGTSRSQSIKTPLKRKLRSTYTPSTNSDSSGSDSDPDMPMTRTIKT